MEDQPGGKGRAGLSLGPVSRVETADEEGHIPFYKGCPVLPAEASYIGMNKPSVDGTPDDHYIAGIEIDGPLFLQIDRGDLMAATSRLSESLGDQPGAVPGRPVFGPVHNECSHGELPWSNRLRRT